MRRKSWKTTPMVRRRKGTLRRGSEATLRPSTRICPLVGISWRKINRSSVDLPAPLGPVRNANSPRSIWKVTSSSARWPAGECWLTRGKWIIGSRFRPDACRGAPASLPSTLSYPLWSDSAGRVEVRFVGRGEERTREATLAAVAPGAAPVAALKQVHSARVVSVDGGGVAGEGGGLVTARPRL